MSNNHLKKPLVQSLGETIKRRIADAQALDGKAIPCRITAVNGATVTVNFEVVSEFTLPEVTMPVATSRYVREPLQVGDTGLAIPADMPIAGISGLGGGLTNVRPSSNLGALVFLPTGSTAWDAVDSGVLYLTGPDGVSMTSGSGSVVLSSSAVTLSFGAHSIVIDATGVTIDGVPFLLHAHSGVTTGPGTSGPVVP